MICSWLVHDLLIMCSLLVHYLSISFSFFVHDFFRTCSWLVHNLFTTCSRCVNDLFMTCWCLLHFCSWLVLYLFMTCSILVHDLFLLLSITLGNKDFAVWDISTDFTLLGVTDTWMNSHFARSGLTFPQYYVFWAILDT